MQKHTTRWHKDLRKSQVLNCYEKTKGSTNSGYANLYENCCKYWHIKIDNKSFGYVLKDFKEEGALMVGCIKREGLRNRESFDAFLTSKVNNAPTNLPQTTKKRKTSQVYEADTTEEEESDADEDHLPNSGVEMNVNGDSTFSLPAPKPGDMLAGIEMSQYGSANPLNAPTEKRIKKLEQDLGLVKKDSDSFEERIWAIQSKADANF